MKRVRVAVDESKPEIVILMIGEDDALTKIYMTGQEAMGLGESLLNEGVTAKLLAMGHKPRESRQ